MSRAGSFLQGAEDLGGFGLGFMRGFVPGGGFLPSTPGSPGYQKSQALGELIGGLFAIAQGVALGGGGIAAMGTGVGAIPGAAAAGAGLGLIAGGVGNIMQAVDHFNKAAEGASTPAQARAAVRREQGPPGITRIDQPNTNVPGSQFEAHTGGKGSPALKQDGTWKHVPAGKDPPSLPRETLDWLRNHGWKI